MSERPEASPLRRGRSALRFVLLIGVVSVFAGHELRRGQEHHRPLPGFLGASAFVSGVVAGVGEFAGYALRIVFGYLSDQTGPYWLRVIPVADGLQELFAQAVDGDRGIVHFVLSIQREGFRRPSDREDIDHLDRGQLGLQC